MTALDIIREKKRNKAELTAAEQVILDSYYTAKDNKNLGRILLAEQAANELRDMQERRIFKEHLPK